MKKVMHFLKSSYLLIIGIVIGATILTVGAAGLTIPTSIDNAVEVIKTIYISSDGVSTGTSSNVIVAIDSNSGNALKVYGNAQVGSTGNKALGEYSSVL